MQAKFERGVDLGLERRESPLHAIRLGVGHRRRCGGQVLGLPFQLGGHVRRCVLRRGEIEVAHEQVLGELARAGDRRAGWIQDEGMTVEDKLILAADECAEGDVGVALGGALSKQALAFDPLAGMVGRGGDVHEQTRSGASLVSCW